MNPTFARARVCLFAALLLAAGCAGCSDAASDGGSTEVSCDDLQREADTCPASTPAIKEQYAQAGATCKSQPRFTAECRACLKGKMCGTTESCDPLCGK